MPNYRRTAYFLDVDAIRTAVREEVAIRGCSHVEIGEQTGIHGAGIGRFLATNLDRQTSLDGDGLVTLIKWSGREVNSFIKRRKTVARHTDNAEQRKIRAAAQFVKSLGGDVEPGENPVDALIRLVATAKENGFLS